MFRIIAVSRTPEVCKEASHAWIGISSACTPAGVQGVKARLTI